MYWSSCLVYFSTIIYGSQLYSYEKSRLIIFQMKTLTLVRCQRLSQHNFYQRQLFLSLTPGERMSDYKVVPLSNLLHLHSLQASSLKHFRDQLIADSAQTEYCTTFHCPSVCPFVCHRRDISHFSHI